ncbi:putative TIM-barrel fold metal-dependent hydrolase [Ancylobacter sp. 3268]|uniref:amidohydrolase family protein n=1 Tax=Ancylobacter sp. 3268 TaxID=2817752 RepID=UPI0028548628|nr:amidohydrolase family protein [Ancylobacter sp. 3268]MDR6955461.1 putative TIM-barrel fold metal-dependent hydrolase [Ancylobacter sp. 3268]
MRLVAIEEHMLPQMVKEAWSAAQPPHDPVSAFADGGDNAPRLADLGKGRLALMDEQGVDVQVLSLTTPGLHNLAPGLAVDMARRVNDLIAETCSRYPNRFQGFAALPTPDPHMAPEELERAVLQLGLKGALLCGRTRERHLDHPALRPMLFKAVELGVPLFIHPQTPLAAVREANYSGISEQADLALSAFGLGWHYEAGLQWVRLAAAGVFDELPSLQIILGHWGEVVLFYLERMSPVFERTLRLNRTLSDYARNNLYLTGSGMWSEAYLLRCLEIVGPDRLLFSTDFPYQYRPGGAARRFLIDAPLNEHAKRGFAHGNWERLTGQGA